MSNLIPPHEIEHNDAILAILLNVLKPGGKLILQDKHDTISSTLKLNGFVYVKSENNVIVCNKPNFEVCKLNNRWFSYVILSMLFF